MDSANVIKINGGSLEIGVLSEGNTVAYATGEMVFEAKAPDLSNYDGAYKMIAGVNADGTGTTDYSASDIATYKYIKLESAHVHDHGTAWESDANEHWNECECGDKANVAAHADTNNDEKCDVCGYAMPKADDPAPTPDKDPDKESDKETDKVTDKNDETDKDDEDENDASAEKGGCGGCGSSAALSALAIVCAVGTALVIKKKED